MQIEQAIDRGDLAALASLTVSSAHGADLLTAAMITLAALGAQEIVDTAGEQGVAGAVAEEPDPVALSAQAGVVAALLASNMSSAAGREAMRLYAAEQAEGSEIAEAVVDYLADLSERALSDQLGGALWSAQEEGRYQTLAGMLATQPASYYVADEIRDKNTCKPCRMIDGTLFVTLEEARAAYPAGGYVDCEGGFRCRGRYEPSWGPNVPARVPPEGQKYHRSIDGSQDLVAAAQAQTRAEQRGNAQWKRLGGGASAETLLAELDDGRRVVRKKYPDWGSSEDAIAQADKEQMGWLVARELDVPAPRVYRTADDVVWMDYVRGRTMGEILDERHLYGFHVPIPDEFMDTDGARRIGLLDSLIGGADRSPANWMIDDLGRLTAIDHGVAWGAATGADPARIARSGGPNALGGDLTDRPAQWFAELHPDDVSSRNGQWIDNPLTKADVVELRRRLEGLRADFVKLDREEWLDYSLAQLSAIGRHATGTENLYA